jgi:hypothetical protein
MEVQASRHALEASMIYKTKSKVYTTTVADCQPVQAKHF